MCTAVVGGSIQRAATSISAASDQRSTMPTMRNRIRDRRNPMRGRDLGGASGISVTYQNNARGGLQDLPRLPLRRFRTGGWPIQSRTLRLSGVTMLLTPPKTKAALPSRTFAHEKPTRRRHCSPITFLSDPSPLRSPMDPIYLTRRAYLLGRVIPDAKSYARNILFIS